MGKSTEFDYIIDRYGLTHLRRGLRIDMNGQQGIVTCGKGGYVGVRFDDEKICSRVHPTWETTYYDEQGTIVMDFKKKTRKISVYIENNGDLSNLDGRRYYPSEITELLDQGHIIINAQNGEQLTRDSIEELREYLSSHTS